MDKFIIVHDSTNDNLNIMLKDEYQNNIYRYEPIESENTFEEAQQLMSYIQKVGIQKYFQEILERKAGTYEQSR